jgi:sugar/nucleoside kinase (ribokinase family)
VIWNGAEVGWVASIQIPKPQSMVVGAGDAFLAGFLSAWKAGKALRERAAWGTVFGAVVAMHGIGGFDPKKAERLISSVRWVE